MKTFYPSQPCPKVLVLEMAHSGLLLRFKKKRSRLFFASLSFFCVCRAKALVPVLLKSYEERYGSPVAEKEKQIPSGLNLQICLDAPVFFRMRLAVFDFALCAWSSRFSNSSLALL